jgi:hypothetical protein
MKRIIKIDKPSDVIIKVGLPCYISIKDLKGLKYCIEHRATPLQPSIVKLPRPNTYIIETIPDTIFTFEILPLNYKRRS